MAMPDGFNTSFAIISSSCTCIFVFLYLYFTCICISMYFVYRSKSGANTPCQMVSTFAISPLFLYFVFVYVFAFVFVCLFMLTGLRRWLSWPYQMVKRREREKFGREAKPSRSMPFNGIVAISLSLNVLDASHTHVDCWCTFLRYLNDRMDGFQGRCLHDISTDNFT